MPITQIMPLISVKPYIQKMEQEGNKLSNFKNRGSRTSGSGDALIYKRVEE